MAANFYDISLDEMSGFLVPRGFEQVEPNKLEGYKEIVFGKRVDQTIGDSDKMLQLTLRVCTGILLETERSRGVGKDAIRVTLVMRYDDGKTLQLSGDKRVHRVETWAKNLGNRLDKWTELLPTEACPRCNMPLLVKTTRGKQKRKFIGCSSWRAMGDEGCGYTRNINEGKK